MKIVLTNPHCRPYVRRGSERFIEELGRYLTAQGHDVTTISSCPERGRVEQTDSGRRVLYREIWAPWMRKIRIESAFAFLPRALQAMRSIDADVVHNLYFVDSWASNLLRGRNSYRTVFHVVGPIVPQFFPRVPPWRYMLARAVRRADRVITISEFLQRIVREHYGMDTEILPIPVDLAQFPLKESDPNGPPTLLMSAAFADPRKGLNVMLDAFQLVKKAAPDAVLRLSGRMPPELAARTLDRIPENVRRDIKLTGVGEVDDLPTLYREATLTVLPSMWEAFGMTLLESWASGTPVVTTDHGGMPELANDPAIGLTFDPQTDGMETRNAAGLADAIVEALRLAEDPQTRYRCRARAEAFSWCQIGPRYEELYASL